MNSLRPFDRSQLSPIERLIRLEIAMWGQDGQNGVTGTQKKMKVDLAVQKREWGWFKLAAPFVLAGLLNGASLCDQTTLFGRVAKMLAKVLGLPSVCG